MDGSIVLVDMDIVAVSASAACEKRSYLCDGVQYATKKEMYAAHPGVSKDEIEFDIIVEAEPFGHARQCARQLLQSILDNNAPVAEYRGYITGPGNFRYKLATIQPYKGNRKDLIEPTWRRDVEEFLIAECCTERVTGYEADDKLAVEFTKDPRRSVLASLDKDFKQIPSLRMYNWRNKEIETVDAVEAARNFYKQMLTGDVIDNIPGVKGIGPEKAEKIVGRLKDEKVMLTAVYAAYQKAYGKNAWDYLVENARLLYLCRTEEELLNPEKAWKPPIVPGV